MLSGFGTTAGERTLPHFDSLFARVRAWRAERGEGALLRSFPAILLQSGLRRTSVTSIRGYYYVIVAEPVAGWAPTTAA